MSFNTANKLEDWASVMRECTLGVAQVPLHRYQSFALEHLSRVLRFDQASWIQRDARSHLEHTRQHHCIVPPDGSSQPSQTDLNGTGPTIRTFAPNDTTISASFCHAAGALTDVLVLTRASSLRGFSRRDQSILRLAIAQMSTAFHLAQRFALHQLMHERNERSCALADTLGRVHACDAAFARLIGVHWPQTPPRTLPEPLMRRCQSHLNAAQAVTFSIDGVDACLQVQASWMKLSLHYRRTNALLSKGEQAACSLYAQGRPHKAVAQALKLSPATVRNQIARAYRKLGVSNKAELIQRMH